jgi:arylsulfatase A-like enzyme
MGSRFSRKSVTLKKVTSEKGRHEVVERYGIDAASLDAIEQEGDREKWPIWDGLSDEHGPIPAFGPARTDMSGRVLMNGEEHAARRDAAIRALAAIVQITDETDTDERWVEVFRGLEGAS